MTDPSEGAGAIADLPPEANSDSADSTERLRQIEATLAGVQDALARLDDGPYGHCSVCGRPIGDEVLATDPTAVVCSVCRSSSSQAGGPTDPA